MGNSRAINAYPDVYMALGQSWGTQREVVIEFPTEKAALKFVGRCASFRRLDRRQNSKDGNGLCEYDALRVSRAGNVVTIIPWAETLPPMRDGLTGQIIEQEPQLTRAEMDAMVAEERQRQRDKDFVEWAKTHDPKDKGDIF
jgi:hypothetical protein